MKEEKFIHLCQPDDEKSCGACCGLYNYANSTRNGLIKRLERRTRLFRKMVGGANDLITFSEMIKEMEDQTKLYEVIYCCEYLGFLDGGKRVGCLLHPLQNGGVDLRDASFYGRELCDGHFCPSYHYLSREEKLSLINIIDDWYLYGLCVTDIDLVKEYFRIISEGVGEMPSADKFKKSLLKDIALRFFSFKISWPFRSPAINRFGKYYFDGSQYMIKYIDYESLGCEKPRFNRIFLSLTSEFQDIGELRKAEEIIQENVDEFIIRYSESS